MSGYLVINPRSGDERPSAEELEEEAGKRGIEVHVLREGEDAAGLARGSDAQALGMAGGDGSLAAVAAVAVERDSAFVCVPYGTRNHFARDLGLDRDDPVAALDAFGGSERRVDVGRVGDCLFLNNVSLGLYARLVHRREHHRKRRDMLARARALLLLARERGHEPAFSVAGERIKAPVLLVASNAYELDLFNVGERERLDDGLLHLYIAHGWLPRSWEERSAERFRIEADSSTVHAAVDGEPMELGTPLDFRLEPGALRVLVPGAPD